MKAQQNLQLTVGICSACNGTGLNAARKKCSTCKGLPVGITDSVGQLLWTRPLTPYAVVLRRWTLFFKTTRLIKVLAIAVLFFAWYGFLLYRASVLGNDIARVNAIWFWFGALFLAYGITLAMRFARPVFRVADVRTQKIPDIEIA